MIQDVSAADIIWASVFGAYYASCVRDQMRDGHGPPGVGLRSFFFEEAQTVVDEAVVEWMERLNQ